jgi:hypothetical protein
MANAYAGRRVGLVWGVVCAATLMNVQPFGLIDAWQFRHEPGWWAWTGYGLAIHLALVLGFVLVGGVMARETSPLRGWHVLGTAGLMWLGYVLVTLVLGGASYLYTGPTASPYRTPINGMTEDPLMRQWAATLVLDVMPVRAVAVAACVFAMAREIGVRLRVAGAAGTPTP